MIHDVKDDPIIQVSSQEPTMSSKYNFEDGGVLDTLLFKLERWNLAHKWRNEYHDDSWCQELPHHQSFQSGTIDVFQVWTSRTGGSWTTSIHARELKVVTHFTNRISSRSMMSRMTPSSKYPVRNDQWPQNADFKDRGFLTHFYSC